MPWQWLLAPGWAVVLPGAGVGVSPPARPHGGCMMALLTSGPGESGPRHGAWAGWSPTLEAEGLGARPQVRPRGPSPKPFPCEAEKATRRARHVSGTQIPGSGVLFQSPSVRVPPTGPQGQGRGHGAVPGGCGVSVQSVCPQGGSGLQGPTSWNEESRFVLEAGGWGGGGLGGAGFAVSKEST